MKDWGTGHHSPYRDTAVLCTPVVCVLSAAVRHHMLIKDSKQLFFFFLIIFKPNYTRQAFHSLPYPHLSEGKEAFPTVRAVEGLLLCAMGGLVLSEVLRYREALVTLITSEDCIRLQKNNEIQTQDKCEKIADEKSLLF